MLTRSRSGHLVFSSLAAFLILSDNSARADLLTYKNLASSELSNTFLETNVPNTPVEVNIGNLTGFNTYEFIVIGQQQPTGSSALMGVRSIGQEQAIKFEQWQFSGKYGATIYGVADYTFGPSTTFGSLVMLDFVANPSTGTTELFVNGVDTGTSVPFSVSLTGLVGLGGADHGNGTFSDNFVGTFEAAATYDSDLTSIQVQNHYNAFVAPSASVPEPSSLTLFVLGGMGLVGGRGWPKRGKARAVA